MKDKTKNTDPSLRVIQFKAPDNHELAQVHKKTVDQLWRQILAYVMDYPDASSNDELWAQFRSAVNLDYQPFIRALNGRGIVDLRAAAKGKIKKERNPGKRETEGSKQESSQLTELTLEALKKRQKAQGIKHLSRMDEIVSNATSILEKESRNLAAMKDDQSPIFLESHLDKATKLNKLASSVYGLDQESKENNVKFNMALLTNYDPHKALQEREVKGVVIQAEVQSLPDSDSSSDSDDDE